MEKINKNNTAGEIVSADYRAAAVFEQYDIDFCCHGDRCLQDVCAEKNLSPEAVIHSLEAVLQAPPEDKNDYNNWPLDRLAQHIEDVHHRYVTEQIPVITQLLQKIVSVHGAQHPELSETERLFQISAGEFSMHMKKEELMLFPFIKKMADAKKNKAPFPAPPFGTVQNPVRMMMYEHDAEGERFRQIARLNNNYAPPADACNTYAATLALLKEFEDDLHLHIHLENNILFPKSLELEDELKAGK